MTDRATADETLAEAIRLHAAAYTGTSDEDEMLSDFAVIAHWQRITDDGCSRYSTHYSRESVPTHIAAGLFTIALGLIGDEADFTYEGE